MSQQILMIGGFFGTLLVAIYFLVRTGKKQGQAEGLQKATEDRIVETNKQNEAVAKQNEQTLKDVEEVHEIHDKLKSDPTYADRVQDRFSRD